MKILLLLLTVSAKNFAWSCNCKWLFGEKIKITVDIEYDTAMLTWNQIAKASVYLVEVKYQGAQFRNPASWKEPGCQIKLKEEGKYEVSVKAIDENKSEIAKGTVAFHYWADQQHKPGGESGPTMNPSQPSDMTNPNSKSQGQGPIPPTGEKSKNAGNSKPQNAVEPSQNTNMKPNTADTTNTAYVFPSGNPSFKVESVFGLLVDPNPHLHVEPKFKWVSTEVPSGECNFKIIHNRKEVVAENHRYKATEFECDLKKPGRYDFIVTVIKNGVQVGWGGTHVFVPGHGPTINLKAYDETDAAGSWRIEWNHVPSADHYNIDVKYWHGGEKQYEKNNLKTNKAKLENIKPTQDKVVVAAFDNLEESLVAWGSEKVEFAEVED